MLKIYSLLLTLLCLLVSLPPAYAATPQPVSKVYIHKYLNTVAAASCLGVYLPQSSTEFDYLRSYGWQIEPYAQKQGKVETHFAVASNYFPQEKQKLYLVTFRGSASGADWKINLKTERVNYGGRNLADMQAIAQGKLDKSLPAVHAGFNSYVDAVLRNAVVDENGSLQGVFKRVQQEPEAHLILTGHSLGGAVATLLGERLASLGLPKDKFTVITFGAPAIGNEAFAANYGEAIDLVRITNTSDPIPGSLQTFFGGYKQFGEQVKYALPSKVGSVQHDMAMYFDYSISEYYRERDRQMSLGRLEPVPDRKVVSGKPVVAVWLQNSKELNKLAFVTDIKRFITDEYRRMLPSYLILGKNMSKEVYTSHDLIELSKREGADYVLICGIDGSRPQQENYWYLTLEQALFDNSGHMLTLGSFGHKVTPAVGNIQAAGENLWQARSDLMAQLPFIITQNTPTLAK